MQVREPKCEVEQLPCYTRLEHVCVRLRSHSDTPGTANRQVAAPPAQGDSGQAVLCGGDGIHYTSDIPTAVPGRGAQAPRAVMLIQPQS